MPLTSSDRLAHYNVTALIGEGGMGQVWQATDTQLNRQVALKILPDAFADDPDRLARFQREAQGLASLNYPGIAAIYGIEELDRLRVEWYAVSNRRLRREKAQAPSTLLPAGRRPSGRWC